MPELPEVECVRRSLAPKVVGRRVRSVRVGLAKLARPTPAEFRRGLLGARVTGSDRHGKLLILELAGGAFWAVHLGMTGQLISAPRRPRADHIHLTIGFDDGGERLYFRDVRQFGFMAYCPDRDALESGPLANFGPDALLIGREEFLRRLSGRRAPVKSLLLDQRLLAGVGNIYADESLHRAGIHPAARPVDLGEDDLIRLHAEVQAILAEALERGGSSVRNFVDARGRPGTFQHAHRVYRRTGRPCPACGAPVQRMVLGGRSTHYCPRCQPLPPG